MNMTIVAIIAASAVIGALIGFRIGRESAIREMAWEEEESRFHTHRQVQVAMIDKEFGIDPILTGNPEHDELVEKWTEQIDAYAGTCSEEHIGGTEPTPPGGIEGPEGPYQDMDREEPL